MGHGIGDEVVAIVFEGDPPYVEIQCHGGKAALDLVVDALCEAGCQGVSNEVLASEIAPSPIRAAALLDLTQAPTLRAAEILLDQTQGALDAELDELRHEIKHSYREALERLDRLCTRGDVGIRLISGWRVVITGRPNVGKSRLLNALAGYKRAIVDATPGTTRDLVTALTAFDGWPIELIDTAGVRETLDPLEQSGIGLALGQLETADLALQLYDVSEPLQPQDEAMLAGQGRSLLVANKADLPPAWDIGDFKRSDKPILAVSAERGDGLDALIAAVVQNLVPMVPEPGAGVPFRPEQLGQIENARKALLEGDRARAVECIETLRAASPRDET
jgi:tRNA modification GTPase